MVCKVFQLVVGVGKTHRKKKKKKELKNSHFLTQPNQQTIIKCRSDLKMCFSMLEPNLSRSIKINVNKFMCWHEVFVRKKHKKEIISENKVNTIIPLRSCNQSIKVEMQIACMYGCMHVPKTHALFWLVWRHIENIVYCAIICVNMHSIYDMSAN